MKTYSILRFYQNSSTPRRTIHTGMTREGAQRHCSDPETSSRTCEGEDALEHTRQFGPWFDGFEEE
jgi:hypothetical protein